MTALAHRPERAFEPLSDTPIFGLLAVRTTGGFQYLRRDAAASPDPGGHLSNLRPLLGEVVVPGWVPPLYDWANEAAS